MAMREQELPNQSNSIHIPGMDTIPLGVLTSDWAGRITYTNPSMRALLGYDEADLALGALSWLHLTPPEYTAHAAQSWEELRRTGACAPYEQELFAKDGRRIPVRVNVSVLEQAPDPTAPIAVFVTDLSELRHTQQTLRASEELRDNPARKHAELANSLLAIVSRVLVDTLADKDMLAKVTQSVVPAFADLCLTWLVGNEHEIKCIEIAHALPTQAAWLRELACHYVLDPFAPAGLSQVIRTGVSEVTVAVDTSPADSTVDMRADALVAQFHPRATLTVALRAHNRVLGAMQFAMTETEHHFSPDDLALAEEIAYRCALALDNTRLYDAELRYRQAAERAAEHIVRLQSVTAALTEAITVGQVARVLVDHSVHAFGASTSAFMQFDDEGQTFDVVYQAGVSLAELAADQHMPQSQYELLTQALLRKELMVFEPATNDASPAANQTPPMQIALPLLLNGRGVAGMTLSFARPTSITIEDRALLLTMARLGAQALERARLYDMEQWARQIAEHAMRRISRLHVLTATLVHAVTTDEVVAAILGVGRQVIGAETCSVMLLTDDHTEFVLVGAVGLHAHADTWQRFAVADAMPFADVVHTHQPVFIESFADRQHHYAQIVPRLTDPTCEAFVALPLLVETRVIGTIGFDFQEAQTFSLEEQALMVTFAQQCAQSLERARLYETEQRARVHQAFLADASRALVDSLDYVSTLHHVAQRAVPTIADFCTMHLVEATDTIRLVAMAQRDPTYASQIEELEQRYPTHLDHPLGLPAIIRTRAPLLVSDMSPALLNDFAQSDDQLKRIQKLELRSWICVPLIARDRVLGVISLFTSGPHARRYDTDDLHLAEELAQRCAQAMDNARLYREAREAVQIRDTFLSIAAHELKTPLTSLLGNVQLLQRRLLRAGDANERTQHSLQVINSQAHRLNNLIAAMLDLSRIELGQLSIATEPVDLVVLTQRIVDEVRPTLFEHTLVLELPDAPLIVAGDAMRLEQVIQNLISNGVKYSPHGGNVCVQVARHDQTAQISIRDQGIGIPTQAIPELFQRFYRAPNVHAEHISGIGVGLFVVKEIVALHGGTIEVQSSEDVGSTFTIVLPIMDERDARSEEHTDEPS